MMMMMMMTLHHVEHECLSANTFNCQDPLGISKVPVQLIPNYRRDV